MADNQGNGGDKLVYFLIGAGIGAVTALLFAPKAGSECVQELAGATKKGLDYARDTGRDFSERATDYYETGIERASDISDRSRDAINEMADRGRGSDQPSESSVCGGD
ncbi:MAG: YtxH domain-containing protein [Acidobacteria bacterium]|nr:YtxH domain-containing protein [Acidobacteriota bacterium]